MNAIVNLPKYVFESNSVTFIFRLMKDNIKAIKHFDDTKEDDTDK